MGEEAFSVIREAMVTSDTRAISRVVLNHRERAVLLEPRDKGMVLWTLRCHPRSVSASLGERPSKQWCCYSPASPSSPMHVPEPHSCDLPSRAPAAFAAAVKSPV